MKHEIIPAIISQHPLTHGAALGTLIPAMAGLVPFILGAPAALYYCLLIADFIITKLKEKRHGKHRK